MKKIYYLLVFTLCSPSVFAQTISSIADGNAGDPSTWSCQCIPAPSDSVLVEHNVALTSDYTVAGTGSLLVGASGKMYADQVYVTLYVDGGATVNNEGMVIVTNLVVNNGSVYDNNMTTIIDTDLLIDALSTFNNYSVLQNPFNVQNHGTFLNNGYVQAGELYNYNTYTQTGALDVNLFGNVGSVVCSSGSIDAFAVSSAGNFLMMDNSTLSIVNSLANSGRFNVALGAVVNVYDIFSNQDPNAGNAMFVNDGFVEIDGDLYNENGLDGSGTFCLTGTSSNLGTVDGSLDICDATGNGIFDFDAGTIAPGVTDCINGCTTVGIDESDAATWEVYPNPALNHLNVPANTPYAVFTLAGTKVLEGTSTGEVDVSGLAQGVYLLQLNGSNTVLKAARFVKL